jgi:LPPG:FO 2-phospho-L-lactate transferase
MLASMGHESSARGVAAMLAPHLDAFVLDTVDADQVPAIEALGLQPLVTDTIMRDHDGRARLAREVLDFVAPPPPVEADATADGATDEPTEP